MNSFLSGHFFWHSPLAFGKGGLAPMKTEVAAPTSYNTQITLIQHAPPT